MGAVSVLVGCEQTFSSGSHFPVAASVETSLEDVVEAALDDDAAKKEIAVSPFDEETYRRKEVWFTAFQVDKVQNPLCAVSQELDEDLLESLPASKYR